MSSPLDADPVVLDRVAGRAGAAADRVRQARSRLARARIEPAADRFGLFSELVEQEADARRQVLTALAGLADGCDDLDSAGRSFSEAFRVAAEVR